MVLLYSRLFFFGLTDVTMYTNMTVQDEIHVLQTDLEVFLPNAVMFIKTELSSKQQQNRVIQEASSEHNLVQTVPDVRWLDLQFLIYNGTKVILI